MPGDPAELTATAAALRSAADEATATETAGRLREVADRFDGLVGEEPDHGTLARLDNSLRELRDATDGEATDHVEQAREHVREYRKGVEGV